MVMPSLPYQGIARRALSSNISYQQAISLYLEPVMFDDCVIVINSEGEIGLREDATFGRNSLKQIQNEIEKWDLQPTRYIMSQQDYDDIVKWGSG
jgi:hypothetical protein